MDTTIVLFLLQDAIINGAIYAIVAIALVLVFAVTRIIFVPQGEFIAFAAFTMSAFEEARQPATAWLLVSLGALSAASTLLVNRRSLSWRVFVTALCIDIAIPWALLLLTRVWAPTGLGRAAAMALTLALIVPMGPMIYRIAFRPMQNASVLVLLIAAMGVHFSLQGIGLLFYGPEGIQTQPIISSTLSFAGLEVTGQSIAVVAITAASLVSLAFFFERTFFGKALRACSSNRLGSQLVGISPSVAGNIAFALAAGLGAISGILVGPIITVYYDSGFMIALKAFVAAIIGGLVSYPLTVAGALGVGLAESFSSFWFSNLKEVLVFALILPFLVRRSLTTSYAAEE